MAFERIQELGEAKFAKVRNALMVGISAGALAREIRTVWGDLADIPEKTLTQQLSRLRIKMAQGAFGAQAAEVLADKTKVNLVALKSSNLKVLEELTALAGMQERRLQVMWDNERKGQKFNVHINPTVEFYKALLLDIQKIRFDLGLDEFKGVVPGIKGKVDSMTLPDGTHMQRGVFDIVTSAEAILQRRLSA
jgi:hypothetical protein